jgi:hypothetical protein
MDSYKKHRALWFLLVVLLLTGMALCALIRLLAPLREFIIECAEKYMLRRDLRDYEKWNGWLVNMSVCGMIAPVILAVFAKIGVFKGIRKLLGRWHKCDIVTVASIGLWGIYFLIRIVTAPNTVWGESDDFKIATISVVNHLSTTISNEDIVQFNKEFPEENGSIEKGSPSFNGTRISWYFPTYSIACLPLKVLLSPLNIPLYFAFLFTNLLCYAGMLVFAFFRLNDVSKAKRMAVVLLLAFSPAMEYINALTYEAFLFSAIACSAVQLYKKNFKSAALLGSIAASANIALSGFVFFIIIAYFHSIFKSEKISGWLKTAFTNMKNILLLGLCCLPVLFQLLYFKILIGKYSPQQDGFSEFSGILPRFWAYLSDYNFSFFAYYPLLIMLFFLCLAISVLKKEYDKTFFGCGILLSLLIYSVMFHINCGQESMHRYNTHLLGALLVFSLLIIPSLLPGSLKKFVMYGCIVSFVLANGVYLLNTDFSYTKFFPIPKLILNNMPQAYNPYPYTFISRTQHIDGGYMDLSAEPYFYSDDNHFIRKILVNKNSASQLLLMAENKEIMGNMADIEVLKQKIAGLKFNRYKGTDYINLSGNTKIIYGESGDY